MRRRGGRGTTDKKINLYFLIISEVKYLSVSLRGIAYFLRNYLFIETESYYIALAGLELSM